MALPGGDDWTLSLRRDVVLRLHGPEAPRVDGPWGSLQLSSGSPGVLAALVALGNGGRTETELGTIVLDTEGLTGLTRFLGDLRQILARGYLARTVLSDGTPLATLISESPFETAAGDGSAQEPWLLSRFTTSRRSEGEWILETPLSSFRIVLNDPGAMGLLHALRRPMGALEFEAFAERSLDIPRGVARSWMAMLGAARMLTSLDQGGAEGISREDKDPVLSAWSDHDLTFHSRSRYGRDAGPRGATFRFAGKIAPFPAVKPLPATDGPAIQLPKPDLERLRSTDPTLATVTESRRSVRIHRGPPLTLQQLGCFLYRTVRTEGIRSYVAAHDSSGGPVEMEIVRRPYPSGGSIHELEFYLTAHSVEAPVRRLVYYYDPVGHRLLPMPRSERWVDGLLSYARQSAAVEENPQLLITFAARYPRMGWKYDGMAYAAILKNVGVVYHGMYLAATAMGLAACALGNGDSDLFAAAVALSWNQPTAA